MSVRNEQIKAALLLSIEVIALPPDGELVVCTIDHEVRDDYTYHVYMPSGMKQYPPVPPAPEQLELKFDEGA